MFKQKMKEIKTYWMRHLKTCGKIWRLKIKYPIYYKIHAMKPVHGNKVVFIENRFPNLTNSFSLLYQTLTEKYSYETECCYLLETQKKGYNKRCMQMIRTVADARCVFVDDASNIVGALPFRKETDVVQTWHACGAFKKWGFSNAKGKFGADIKELTRFPFYAKYSLVTVSSAEVAWAYADAFNIQDYQNIVRPTGVSRTDVFFNPDFAARAHEHLYELIPQAKERKVILYAPTFRGSVSSAAAPNDLNPEAFCERFADQYVLLCKHHPSVKKRPEIPEQCKDTVLDVTDELPIEELLCISDICITDYSSIVFEYSLFEKPILIYAYDIDQYSDWRGFYYGFESFVPGPILHNNNELLDCIQQIGQYDIEPVIRFKQKFMGACDGHATERIIQEIFGEK